MTLQVKMAMIHSIYLIPWQHICSETIDEKTVQSFNSSQTN